MNYTYLYYDVKNDNEYTSTEAPTERDCMFSILNELRIFRMHFNDDSCEIITELYDPADYQDEGAWIKVPKR